MTTQIININIYNRSAGEQNEMNNGLKAISKNFKGNDIANINFSYKTDDVPASVFLNSDTCKEDRGANDYRKQEGNDLIINLNCAGASLLNQENAVAQITKYNKGAIEYNEGRYNDNEYDSRQNPGPPARALVRDIDHEQRIDNNLDFLANQISQVINNTHARNIKVNLLVCKSDEFSKKLQNRLVADGKKIQVSGYNFVYDINGEYFISYPNTLKDHLDKNGCFSEQKIKDLNLEKYKISLENHRQIS